jgi:hypothetical protein
VWRGVSEFVVDSIIAVRWFFIIDFNISTYFMFVGLQNYNIYFEI